MVNAHGLVTTMVSMMVSVVMVTMVMLHGNCPWPMAHGPWSVVMVMVVSHGPMVNAHGGEEFSHGAMVNFPMLG